MYLRFVRHNQLGGNISRGSLYTVHFEPNEKGGYNEHLIYISDVYEVASGESLPLTLIYPVRTVFIDGRYRLAFGIPSRYSMLHLIDYHARDRFFMELTIALHEHEEVRIEIAEK